MTRVLITGATGLIGTGLIRSLLLGDEQIRILSRGANDDSDAFPADRVEPFAGDVSNPRSLQGAASGCDVIVHIAGIATERPPGLTFESVNVEGTRAMLDEAKRAGVRRFIHISSLGAERGKSEYHRSKRKSEDLVRAYDGEWMILRPGNVYGPGDSVISELMTMIRTLPVVPLINLGDQPFQPVWYEDLGNAIARAIRRDGPWHSTLDIAGPETIDMAGLIERICELTARDPVRVPVPDFLATLASKLGQKAGVDLPIDENRITMLLEENVVRPGSSNALIGVFGIEPVRLDQGLRLLADMAPEQTPSQGTGPLQHKTFSIEIIGSGLSPEQLMNLVRDRGTELMDVEFASEPGTPQRIELGATLTGDIPLRGHFQVRVEESEPDRITMSTLAGHPLAGIVRFRSSHTGRGIQFVVEVFARAASTLDLVAVQTVGRGPQEQNWEHLCERLASISGGQAPDGVQREIRELDEEEAQSVEEWITALIASRRSAAVEPEERSPLPA